LRAGKCAKLALLPQPAVGAERAPPPTTQPAAPFAFQILFNITGSVRPGEVLALMGPSGSGKTTLLSILGGRTPTGARQEGAVLFNGAALDKRTKRQVGYVMQDDLLYE
jgi:ABC-type multidrug transport system ATPase subunit